MRRIWMFCILEVLLLGLMPGLATGGFNARQAQADIGALSLSWQLLAPVVDPRTGTGVEGTAASLIGDKIYVSHGNRGGDVATLSIYDVPSDDWTHGGPTAPDASIVRSELAGGTAIGRHYAIGGRTGPNAEVEEFDPATTTWTVRAPMSAARGGQGAASWEDHIYVVGGRDGATFGAGTIFDFNEVYDPITDSWTPLSPMPIGVSDNYATIAYEGKVYVFGGATDPSTVINTVQIYDIAADTWSTGRPMPTARAAAMAGVICGQIAVFGGYDPAVGNLAITELYDPLTDAWSPGPTMMEPVSEIAQGVTYNESGIYAIGTGIYGAAGSVVQVLTGTCVEATPTPSSKKGGPTIPEPTTIILVSLGLAGLASYAQRQRQRKGE